ncbi:eukaryotic translation initiation factor 2 subunit alpha-like protein [Iris pallida]|uniref:Eukaryotic translation initiation factor 2 subunit alpha-like protein n=1 Tax=Iris pallida TaxID=29817 RepID=A0AAX6GIK1_IRIPA|nr:eukaryotic translation initiation factor 2 subunit alpha-like protein [Iris pallida]
MWSANGPNLRYNKSKLVHSIMRHVAETLGLDLNDLYVHVGWPLYRKYGHAFEAFKVIVTDPDSVLDGLTRKIKEVGPDGQEVTKVVPALTAEVKDSLVRNIRQRMTPQPLKIRADVEMKCFQFDGVLHIKEAMKRAEASGNEDCPVKMKLVAPPLYVLTTQTLDKEQGITVLTNAIKACTEVIDSHKGKLVVKEAPRAVSERDDKLLAVSFSSSFIGSKTLGIILMDTQYVVHMFVGSNFHDDDKYVGDIVLELKDVWTDMRCAGLTLMDYMQLLGYMIHVKFTIMTL